MIESKIWSIILHRKKLDSYTFAVRDNPIKYQYVVDNGDEGCGGVSNTDGDITVTWTHQTRGFVGRVLLRMSISSNVDTYYKPAQSTLNISCDGITDYLILNEMDYPGVDKIDREREMIPDMMNFVEGFIQDRVTETVDAFMMRRDTVVPVSDVVMGIPTIHNGYTGIGGEMHVGTPEIKTEVINKEKTSVFKSIKSKLEAEMDKWCGGTIEKLRSEYISN